MADYPMNTLDERKQALKEEVNHRYSQRFQSKLLREAGRRITDSGIRGEQDG